MERKNFLHALLRTYSAITAGIVLLTVFSVNYMLMREDRTRAMEVTKIYAEDISRILSQNSERLNRIINESFARNEQVEDLYRFMSMPYPEYLRESLSLNLGHLTEYLSTPRMAERLYQIYPDLLGFSIRLDAIEGYFVSNIEQRAGMVLTEAMPPIEGGINLERFILHPLTFLPIGSIQMTFSNEEIEYVLNRRENQQIEMIVLNNNREIIYQYGTRGYLSPAERGNHFFSEVIGNNGQRVMVSIPRASVYLSAVIRLVFLLGTGIGLSFILFFILNRVFKKYTDEVRDIVFVTNKITGNHMQLRIHLDGKKGELLEISQSINKMLDSIDDHIETIYKLEIKQKEATLDALQTQINPHFLYNTLEFIRMYAVSEGQEELGDIVYNFGSLMRNNISYEKEIELKKELEFCRKYIELYKARNPERLSYKINFAAPFLEDMMIPKFTIQPLVENYLLHGLDYSRSNNKIEISVSRDDRGMKIEVSDNGKGLSPQRLNFIKDRLQNPQTEEGKSIGLASVALRLKIYYKNNAKIEVLNNETGGVSVNIYISS